MTLPNSSSSDIVVKWLNKKTLRNWSSSICVETRLRARRLGFSSQWGQWWNFFSSLPRPNRFWVQWVPPGALTPG